MGHFLRHALTPAAALVLLLPGFAAQAEIKEFKDWIAACDNQRNCSAYALAGSDDIGAYLRIERGGEADAPVIVTLSVDPREAKGFTVSFDDPALPGLPGGVLTGEEGEGNDFRRVTLSKGGAPDDLLASLRKAGSIVITRQLGGTQKLEDPVTRISLSGAAASLLWIDEQQKRLDTVTALVRRGDKPASSIPPQPAAPVIVAAKPANAKAPRKHPLALLTKGRALCDDDDKSSKLEDVNPLGGGLFLYQFTCPESSGAYNFFDVFLIGPAGKVAALRPAQFKRPPGLSESGRDNLSGLTNATFDPQTMTLTSFNKGRGIGDCGVEEQWVWDGKAFRLVLERAMPECRGVPLDDWPVTYRANVKR